MLADWPAIFPDPPPAVGQTVPDHAGSFVKQCKGKPPVTFDAENYPVRKSTEYGFAKDSSGSLIPDAD